MADTIERATDDLRQYVHAMRLSFEEAGVFEAKVLALIAAVRAEQRETITQLQETLTAALEAWKEAAAVRAENAPPRRHATDCKIHFAEGGYEPCTCGLNPS